MIVIGVSAFLNKKRIRSISMPPQISTRRIVKPEAMFVPKNCIVVVSEIKRFSKN